MEHNLMWIFIDFGAIERHKPLTLNGLIFYWALLGWADFLLKI
jgi:hypothetical protein